MTVEKQPETAKFLWEVCGHENIVVYLKSAILNNNLHHAYIFAGQNGLGKKNVADRLIQTLYCQGQSEYKPCGECSTCRQLASGVYPDIFYIRRLIDEKTGKLKREIIIDQIRELKFKLAQGTLLSSWKIALIEEAELLNISAANSLLKVLEEPTKKTIIILLVSDLSAVLPTISSRCQTINFLPVNQKEIKDFIAAKYELSNDRANRIAKLSLGRPGLAIKFAEDNDYYEATTADIKKFQELIKTPLANRFKVLDDLVDWHKDESLNIGKLNQLLDNWLIGLRDYLLNDIGSSGLAALGESKNNPPLAWLLKTYLLIGETRKNLDFNISSKNLLENLIINI